MYIMILLSYTIIIINYYIYIIVRTICMSIRCKFLVNKITTPTQTKRIISIFPEFLLLFFFFLLVKINIFYNSYQLFSLMFSVSHSANSIYARKEKGRETKRLKRTVGVNRGMICISLSRSWFLFRWFLVCALAAKTRPGDQWITARSSANAGKSYVDATRGKYFSDRDSGGVIRGQRTIKNTCSELS